MTAEELAAQQRQQETAEALKPLLERVGALATGLKEVTDVVSRLKSEGLITEDVKKAVGEYERMRAQIETLQDSIRTRKNGLWFPGVEDTAKKFNLLRLAIGVKQGKPEQIAPFEMEVVKETRKAWEKSMALGDPAKRAGHVMWDDQSGGIWVPDQVIGDVIGPIYVRSCFVALVPEAGRTRVSVIDGLTGNPVKIPEFEGGMIAYWIGEEDNYVESKTKSGNLTMTPKKLGVLTRLTEEMMQMANPAFDAFLRRDMIRAAAKKLDFTIAYGTGSANMPRGLANHPRVIKWYAKTQQDATPGSPDAGGTELDFDGLMELQGAMEDTDIAFDETFATISSPRYFRRLKKLKIENYSGQTTGKPYLLGAPFLSDERLRGLIGDYDKSTQIPTKKMVGGSAPGTHDKATDVFSGNFGEVVLGRWSGVQILSDGGNGTGFINDQTYIKMRMWADVEVRQGKALRHVPDVKCRD